MRVKTSAKRRRDATQKTVEEEVEQESSEGNHRVAAVACRRSSSSSSNRVNLCQTLAIVEEHQSSTTEPNCDLQSVSLVPSRSPSENVLFADEWAINPHTLSAEFQVDVTTVAVEIPRTNNSIIERSTDDDDDESEIDLRIEELGIVAVVNDAPCRAAVSVHPLMDLDAIQPDILHLSTDNDNNEPINNAPVNQPTEQEPLPLTRRKNI